MSDEISRRRSLESLKKEAKRWFDALRRNVSDARARFERAVPDAPTKPTLRDVQHAMGLEHGFSGWTEVKHRLTADAEETARSLEDVSRVEHVTALKLGGSRSVTERISGPQITPDIVSGFQPELAFIIRTDGRRRYQRTGGCRRGKSQRTEGHRSVHCNFSHRGPDGPLESARNDPRRCA